MDKFLILKGFPQIGFINVLEANPMKLPFTNASMDPIHAPVDKPPNLIEFSKEESAKRFKGNEVKKGGRPRKPKQERARPISISMLPRNYKYIADIGEGSPAKGLQLLIHAYRSFFEVEPAARRRFKIEGPKSHLTKVKKT